MQLKALIKNRAKESNISAQLLLQNYMLERLLERMSLSEYRDQFIIKGGFLIASLIGLENRTTMDLDTTVKGFHLTQDKINDVFEQICAIKVDDDIRFEIVGVEDIREQDDYPGLRVNLKANYAPLSVPLTVDVTTGDKITPGEIKYSFKLLFDERNIHILTYNLETILAEKIETILSRGAVNTRPRDFYDVYMIQKLRSQEYDPYVLHDALEETTKKRGSLYVFAEYQSIIETVRQDLSMQKHWDKYGKKFSYAKDIPFDDACNSILEVMSKIC